MKLHKIIFLLLFISVKISATDIVDNLDMFLSTEYVESNDSKYLYLEILINNRNEKSIFLLKNYEFIKCLEEENGIILFLSSWIDKIDYFKNTSALYHNPRMIEIRSMQVVYLPILLKIPNTVTTINKNKVIKKIEGLKYSLTENITKDISWAKNVDEFVLNIRKKVCVLEFNYNEYTKTYGNVINSQIKPPEWMIGTWKVVSVVLDGRTINTTTEYFKVVSDDIFDNNESTNGWILTRIQNSVRQSYKENVYNLDIVFVDGRTVYYHFIIDNGYLVLYFKNHNGLFTYKLKKE